MTTMFDLNAALAGGGATLKPETVGESVGGTIVHAEVRQATDFESGKPDFWDDGKPKQQIVITVKTGHKTDDGADEEGTIYVKAWGAQKKALMEAIRATGQDANTALAAGNYFTMTLVGEEPNKNPRLAATKLYKYEIKLQANVGGALDEPTPAPAPAAPAPAAPDNSVTTARKLIAAGSDNNTIAIATGLDPTVIDALRAN